MTRNKNGVFWVMTNHFFRVLRETPGGGLWAAENGIHFCDATERASLRPTPRDGRFPCILEVGINPQPWWTNEFVERHLGGENKLALQPLSGLGIVKFACTPLQINYGLPNKPLVAEETPVWGTPPLLSPFMLGGGSSPPSAFEVIPCENFMSSENDFWRVPS